MLNTIQLEFFWKFDLQNTVVPVNLRVNAKNAKNAMFQNQTQRFNLKDHIRLLLGDSQREVYR